MPELSKICTGCKKNKPLSKYYIPEKGWPRTKCRACEREIYRAWYKKNKAKPRNFEGDANIIAIKKATEQRIQAEIAKLKKACGYRWDVSCYEAERILKC